VISEKGAKKNNFPEMGYGFRRINTDHHGSDPVLIRIDPSKSVAHLLAKIPGLYFFRRPLRFDPLTANHCL
jgi:hypothetical protein